VKADEGSEIRVLNHFLGIALDHAARRGTGED
jgi:hypothetical protein